MRLEYIGNAHGHRVRGRVRCFLCGGLFRQRREEVDLLTDSTVQVQAVREGDTLRVQLTGEINEEFGIGRFLELIGDHSCVVLDTRGISAINSSGVRNWLLLLEKLPTSCKIEYEAVSLALVEQANMILSFLRRGTIVSFMVPYFCYECQEPEAHAVSAQDPHLAGNDPRPPPVQCSRCGAAMDFDDDPREYFMFLKVARGDLAT